MAQGGQFARQGGQFAGHEVAETLARGIDILAVLVDKIHRHIERMARIALKAHAVLEHKRQHAAAIGVGIGPDMAAETEEAVRLALGERRIGEQSRGERLQSQAGAEFLHHIGFGGEIEIHLHGTGAIHHVEAEIALLGHILGHDLVAPLGHHRDIGAAPFWLHAEAGHGDAHLLTHLAHLLEMGADLNTGLMDGFQRRARQFELPARFQRDRLVVEQQRDGLAILLHRLPAETLQFLQQPADAGGAIIGHRAEIMRGIGQLFVFGADAPILLGLAALGDIGNELGKVGDRGLGGLGRAGHGNLVASCYRYKKSTAAVGFPRRLSAYGADAAACLGSAQYRLGERQGRQSRRLGA